MATPRSRLVAPQQITRHLDPDPNEDPWVDGPPPPETVVIVDPDPGWPDRFQVLAGELRRALGPAALTLEHVGSTAVPGLAAKDVIDIVLTVADPRAEDTYLPALEALGRTGSATPPPSGPRCPAAAT
jgi:hypothetical protein